jgi:hypothetical protein
VPPLAPAAPRVFTPDPTKVGFNALRVIRETHNQSMPHGPRARQSVSKRKNGNHPGALSKGHVTLASSFSQMMITSEWGTGSHILWRCNGVASGRPLGEGLPPTASTPRTEEAPCCPPDSAIRGEGSRSPVIDSQQEDIKFLVLPLMNSLPRDSTLATHQGRRDHHTARESRDRQGRLTKRLYPALEPAAELGRLVRQP